MKFTSVTSTSLCSLLALASCAFIGCQTTNTDEGKSVTDGGPSSTGGNDSGGATGPKCTASPTLLIDGHDLIEPDAGAEGISAGMDVAVSATDLYVAVDYIANGALLRVPIRGGTPVVMAPISGAEQGLLVTGDSVVFVQAGSSADGAPSGEVVRIGLQGGPTTVLASDRIARGTIFGPNAVLASDGQNVYFAAADGTKSVPLAGGAVQTLTAHTGSIALVGSDLVVADSTAEGLYRVPSGGGAETTLVTGLSGQLGPVVGCGSTVCWAGAVEVTPSQQGTGTLMQLGPSGAHTLASDPALYVVYRLAFDGSTFFATMLADASIGTLATVPADGGSPSGGGSGSGLAVDDECLYLAGVQGVYSIQKAPGVVVP